MPLTTRTTRLLTRIVISTLVLVVFALHVASKPRFEVIDRMENYLYDVRVRMTMLVIELDDPYLEDQLDRIADTLSNDERYLPAQFAALLAALAEPEPEAEDIDG